MIAAFFRRPSARGFFRGRSRLSSKNSISAWRGLTVASAVVLAGVLAVALALPAEAAPIRRLGQSSRSLAMGGTGVSFSNDEMALFYNPAGLGAIDKGWFEFLPLVVEASADGVGMATSAGSSSMSDPATLVTDNIGKEIQLRLFAYPNAIVNFTSGVTLGVTYFQEVQLEMMIRNMATPEIEAFYRHDSGTAAGFSFPMLQGQMLGGVSMHNLARSTGEGTIGAADLLVASSAGSLDVEAELGSISGSGRGYDLGLIWRMETLASLRTQFGMVVNNFGGMGLKDSAGVEVGKVPQEVSMGWSFRPQFPFPTLMALEMRDMTAALSPDSSIGKRIHFGFEMGLIPQDKSTNFLTLRGGYHAGMPSYGVELSLWHFFGLQYVEYYEEFGDVAGEDPRKRQLFQILIGY